MRSPRLFTILALLALLAAPAAHAQTTEPARYVRVSGEGVIHVQPDEATVRFGVVTRAEDPETARQQNAEAARNAMNAVRALGIEERKMRLETLRLQPAREYDPETRRYKEVGFEAVRQVVVDVEDLEVLPALIAAVVQQGANRLDGVSYDVQKRDVARNEALREAVLSAQAKARLLAETLGAELGPVQSIDEQQFDFPRPVFRMEMAEAAVSKDEAAPEPEAYAAGEIEVRATVQVVFTLQ